MRLVDTSAWIEWLIGSPTGARLAEDLPKPAEWLVPSIVQLELAKWLRRTQGEYAVDRVIAFTNTCMVVELDTAIALAAAEICTAHRLATADAIVYATVRLHDADLLTCDRHFDGLDRVRFVAKSVS